MALLSLALAPGIGTAAKVWLVAMPSFIRLVAVDYRPSAADMNLSDPSAKWSSMGRFPGGPGDVIEVAALRMLTVSLNLSLHETHWALAGHSSGGTIAKAAGEWLPEGDAHDLLLLLELLEGRPPKQPIAAISMEGTLLPCDVEGWAPKLSDPYSRLSQEMAASSWERSKESTLAASLLERSTEVPSRHLSSIRRWLELPDGPPFVYMAGTKSYKRNRYVFPALRKVLAESGAPASRLQIILVPGAGHIMYDDAPGAVRDGLAAALGPAVLAGAAQVPDQAAPWVVALSVPGNRPAIAVAAGIFLIAGAAAAGMCRHDHRGLQRSEPLLLHA